MEVGNGEDRRGKTLEVSLKDRFWWAWVVGEQGREPNTGPACTGKQIAKATKVDSGMASMGP